MRNIVASIVGVLAMVVLAVAARAEDQTVPIVVSPSTINLQWKGQCITVHADIPYSEVVSSSVTLKTLNGSISATATFPDDRGDLVAKFSVEDVRRIVELGMVPLTLAGDTRDGTFSGTDTVRVIDTGAKK